MEWHEEILISEGAKDDIEHDKQGHFFVGATKIDDREHHIWIHKSVRKEIMINLVEDIFKDENNSN